MLSSPELQFSTQPLGARRLELLSNTCPYRRLNLTSSILTFKQTNVKEQFKKKVMQRRVRPKSKCMSQAKSKAKESFEAGNGMADDQQTKARRGRRAASRRRPWLQWPVAVESCIHTNRIRRRKGRRTLPLPRKRRKREGGPVA